MRTSRAYARHLISTLTFLALLTLPYTTHAQTILPASLPPCHNVCTPLINAQKSCLPPAAPVTSDQIYRSCFCQSGYLTSLRSTTTGLCDIVCDADSLKTIRSWFLGFCNAVTTTTTSTSSIQSKPPASVQTKPAATTTSPIRNTALPATATAATIGAFTTDSLDEDSNTSQRGWWSTHWNWVLMLIILTLIGILATIAGVLIKRRYKRRQAAKTNPSHHPYNHHHDAEAGIQRGAAQTTQEMLQSGEWGPLGPKHHTGYREGYGNAKGIAKGVRFDDDETAAAAAAAAKPTADGEETRKEKSEAESNEKSNGKKVTKSRKGFLPSPLKKSKA